MLRLALALLSLSFVFFACGTPCSRIAGAEQAATDKGQACNGSDTTWSQSKLTTCEENLKNCTEQDMKWMDTYADCLHKLPVCADGQGFSWGLQRVGCLESVLNMNASCRSGL